MAKKIIDKSVLPTSTITDLPDKPLIPSNELKAKFDAYALGDKPFINGMIDVLQSEVVNVSGSYTIGHNSTNVVARNVGDGLEEIALFGKSAATALPVSLALKADKATTDSLEANKANKIDVYTKAELVPFLSGGDTLIKYEVFTILNSNLGNGTFSYSDKDSNTVIGTLDGSGYQIFTLQSGTYPMGQNRINITVNDTLQRSVASSGLLEIDTTHIALTSPEGSGAEITIQYFEHLGLTNTGMVSQGTVAPPSDFYWFKEV